MKIPILIAIVCLLFFLVYRVLDNGVTIDHLQSQVKLDKCIKSEMLFFLKKGFIGRSQHEIEQFAQEIAPSELTQKEVGVLEAGFLRFNFRNDKCYSIVIIE